ncbi:hypothetical protein U1Q18_033569 [Sarracenia purpurea var. burkii]
MDKFTTVKEKFTVHPTGDNHAQFICRKAHGTHPIGIFYGESPLEYSFTLLLLEGGIIIGPSVLGRNKQFARYIFPDNATYVFRNVGMIGFMYFVFLAGVKMDLTLITKAGKKQWFTALFGVTVPLVTVLSIALGVRKSLDKEMARASSIISFAASFAITSFPVLYQIIKELNLLSSEVGRLALSTVMISDVIGLHCIVVFELVRQWEAAAIDALWYFISFLGILAALAGARQAMFWIIRTTPEGKPVEQAYVVAILLLVMVVALVSDVCGLAISNGPLWLGLAVPDGPPLGATLVERTETIITEILMPFSFAFVVVENGAAVRNGDGCVRNKICCDTDGYSVL